VSRRTENTGFTCKNCDAVIFPLTNGSYRNHCPICLYSLHMDNKIGDRKNNCHGLMKPYKIQYNGKKGWQIVHKCKRCGAKKLNRIAPDDMDAVISFMGKY